MENYQNNPTAIVDGTLNGRHVADGPLTTAATREASPSLLLNEIDSRIVKIRPMSTPIDQISRMIGARKAKSMVVDYYSVDTKPVQAEIVSATAFAASPDFPDMYVGYIKTSNDAIFSVTDTVFAPKAFYEAADDKLVQGVAFYVLEKSSDQGVRVVLLAKDVKLDTLEVTIEDEENILVRMGRAAGELDVQTAQFEALPTKASNYCQIFKVQIEQSALTRLSAKEAGWTFNDQEEVAIMDMRMGMEKSFLFGVKSRLTDPRNYDEVLFTGGIWHQAGGEFKVSLDRFSASDLNNMMIAAFTGEAAGSNRKILLAGTNLIKALSELEYTKTVSAKETVARWGIDFNEMVSKFGTLYVIHSEVFDQCGHADDGLIIDPEYLTKYTHVPFKVETLDLKRSGVRNTDAIVATEASCMVLRHPKAHIKIISK